MNGDMLSDIPIAAVAEQHHNTNADVTLVIAPAENFPEYSGLYFDESLRFCGTQPTDPGKQKYHYCGLQIVGPRAKELIPAGQRSEIFRDVYSRYHQELNIRGFVYNGLWLEIGTLKTYLQTSARLIEHPMPAHLQPNGMNGLVSQSAQLHPEARVANSIVMKGASIDAGVFVENSIIGWDVQVKHSVQGVALARGILPWHIR
jgi:NDP-sugar pyrophosphorylase family protein